MVITLLYSVITIYYTFIFKLAAEYDPTERVISPGQWEEVILNGFQMANKYRNKKLPLKKKLQDNIVSELNYG